MESWQHRLLQYMCPAGSQCFSSAFPSDFWHFLSEAVTVTTTANICVTSKWKLWREQRNLRGQEPHEVRKPRMKARFLHTLSLWDISDKTGKYNRNNSLSVKETSKQRKSSLWEVSLSSVFFSSVSTSSLVGFWTFFYICILWPHPDFYKSFPYLCFYFLFHILLSTVSNPTMHLFKPQDSTCRSRVEYMSMFSLTLGVFYVKLCCCFGFCFAEFSMLWTLLSLFKITQLSRFLETSLFLFWQFSSLFTPESVN